MEFRNASVRYAWKLPHVAGLIAFLVVATSLLLVEGCARREVREEPVAPTAAPKRWTCDKEADEALARHDYQEGIRLHRKLLEKEPDNALALYHLGYAYGQTGDHVREVFYYERAAELGFEQDHVFFNLGMAYGELNRIEEAITAFQRALELHPHDAENHFGLALAYQRGVKDDLAEEEFLKAIALDPAHIEARMYLSMLYADKGQMQKAASQLRDVLEIDPDHGQARHFLKRIERE